jgi:ABC-2 type transport system ATP-binding protein
MSNQQGIIVNDVTKMFGANLALEHVSITFEPEKIYGLLGRNGAGKTTLLNLITNRIFANKGDITIDGLPAIENDHAQEKIYMMSEQNFYPENFVVKQVFDSAKQFYQNFDSEFADELCKRFELNPKKKIRELSTGYTSIYKVITALCINVPYILLDEPVLGLDANHRELFYRCLLEAYAKLPRTFILSTHLIEEVSNVIEDVIIIKEGKLLRHQTCEELLQCGFTVSGKASEVDAFVQGKEVIGFDSVGGLKTVSVLGKLEKGSAPPSLEISKLDLQKLFIQLTNH